MTDLVIREYDEPDRDAVLALWDAAGLVVPWNDAAADLDRAIETPTSTVFVGHLEGRLVAAVMAGYDGHRGWIYYLAVDPSEQGRGFGDQMLAHAEGYLIGQGAPKVQLMVRETNADVQSFYQTRGYKRSEVVTLGKFIEG